MTVGVLSPGKGPVRRAWVCYHAGDATWSKKLPDDVVLCAEGFPWGKGLYQTPTPLPEVAAMLEKKLGCKIASAGVAGFSEGCQAVKAQLRHNPSAAIAIDGAHASNNPLPPQVAAWTAYARTAIDGPRVFVLTHTTINTWGKYRTTKEVAGELIAQLGASWAEDDGALPLGKCRVAGNVLLAAYPGTDAPSHIEQARLVMPAALEWATQRMHAPFADRSSPAASPASSAALLALAAAGYYLFR